MIPCEIKQQTNEPKWRDGPPSIPGLYLCGDEIARPSEEIGDQRCFGPIPYDVSYNIEEGAAFWCDTMAVIKLKGIGDGVLNIEVSSRGIFLHKLQVKELVEVIQRYIDTGKIT